MKKLIAILIVLVLATKSFSQTHDHSITLGPTESFIKLNMNQIIDSLNMNQTGPEVFQWLEIRIKPDQISSIDSFMKECKSVQSILNKYGKPRFDVVFESNSNIKRPLSGFYYAFGEDEYEKGKFNLVVAYPR
jgi:hypothetical protein